MAIMRPGDGRPSAAAGAKLAATSSADPNVAITAARQLLGAKPDLAAAKARQILATAPGRLDARLLLGAALRRAGDPAAAVTVLRPLVQANPAVWGFQFELGAALAALGETEPAIEALRRATDLNPQSSLAWHALGDQLAIAGDLRAAEAAQARELSGSVNDAALRSGLQALLEGDLAKADPILSDRFGLHPTDVVAVRLLADAAMRRGSFSAAEALLRPVLDTAPNFMPARQAYAVVLLVRNEPQASLVHLNLLIEQAPRTTLFRSLRGSARLQVGDYDGALADLEASLDADPDQPRAWLSYGHVLRTIGRRPECIDAYRQSLNLQPTLGEAYWSLANLKVVRFDTADLAAMEGALARPNLSEDDRAHIHLSLAKAFEDERQFDTAFDHYAKGNALRRSMSAYDWQANRDYVRRNVATFTESFFRARAGVGDPSPDPIFVVGLPRSGSTLIEQILSSHPLVEGVSELPDLIAIATRVSSRQAAAGEDLQGRSPGAEGQPPGSHYPAMLESLPAEAFADLGRDYIERTRVHRKLDRPFFIDKLPSNFMQLGLLHLILPNAKIIDARRNAMACCFSGFKQNFARGADYSYDLSDLGRYYVDYLALMAHFDRVLPGRVHRVQYETLIADPEIEVRRLLTYCGLQFDPTCLRFYETERPVRTASSEQVRQPLFTEGLDHWKNFEPWLAPLKLALGPDIA
jgi:tetratricopeptide (TPR) repeat protein